MCSQAEQQDLIAVAAELAMAARLATLRHFRSAGLSADNKGSGSFDPVTIADRESEDAMRAILDKRRPNDGILGEERKAKASQSGLTWVLDPIDGTKAFLAGLPTWGVLIALSDENGPLYGVIDQPYIQERFEGGFGRAIVKGPMGEVPLKTRAARPLDEATIMTTFPEVGSELDGQAFHRLAKSCRLTRYGGDCYAYAMVAAGQIDLVVEAGLQAYDVQAPIAVITAAGGIVTDWKGQPAHQGGRILAAANRNIHATALDLLNSTA